MTTFSSNLQYLCALVCVHVRERGEGGRGQGPRMGKDEDAGRLSDVVMESASCKCVRESAGFLHPFANETQDSVYRKCVYMQQNINYTTPLVTCADVCALSSCHACIIIYHHYSYYMYQPYS